MYHEKKFIRIISDSIPKRISAYRFNQGINNGFCRLKCFPGASVANLNYYANPTLRSLVIADIQAQTP